MRRRQLAWLLLTLLFLPTARAQDSPRLDSRRNRILSIAEVYAAHRWRPASPSNLFHGVDADGVRIDTPDQDFHSSGWDPDSWNTGIPYQWGGFSTPEEFDDGVREGLYAGHLPKNRGSRASGHAVGVDCSGLVSRCWELPYKQSTRSLGELCYTLDSYDELLPGDVLNRYDAHVMVFKSWANEGRTHMRVIEAITPCVLENEREVAALKDQGYQALRYRPLDPRWSQVAVAFEDPTRTSAAKGRWVANDAQAAPGAAELGMAFDAARVGDWARYRTVLEGAQDETEVRTIGVAAKRTDEIDFHVRRVEDGLTLERLDTESLGTPLIDEWLSLALTDAKSAEREIRSTKSVPGFWEAAGQRLPAERIELDVRLNFRVGGRTIAVDLAFSAIYSREIPILHLIAADHTLVIHYSDENVQEIHGSTRTLAFRRIQQATPVGAGARR